ncbi:neuralized-like protein 4 [Ptychodera flava]|uniref:neuralized-like protein 4 n=1 Tax=Ptychodera flava TaxID=63121 RepID=UPI00396A972D
MLTYVYHVLSLGLTGTFIEGDKTLKGTVLGQNKGRPTDDNRDPAKKNHIFLSPSIRYAGHDQYALPSDYLDEERGMKYRAKTVFRVLIRPKTYEVGPASFKGGDDPNFSPQELEWSTDRRGNIVIYALLVNLEEQ